MFAFFPRFDLALNLGELEMCLQLAGEANSEQKWRQVAELSQQKGDLSIAQSCLLKAHDYPGLLLQATASGRVKWLFGCKNSRVLGVEQ